MPHPTDDHSLRCRTRRRFVNRRGTATVELAVCLPMLALIVFGSIQACSLIYLKHAVTSAAYEGTMELIRPNSSNSSVTTRVQNILDMHNIRDAQVTLLPAGVDITDLPTGTPVEIRVRADVDANLAISGWFPTVPQIEHSAVGPR